MLHALDLTPKQYEVVLMYYGNLMAEEEIADRLDIAQSKVSERLGRVRAKYPMLKRQYHRNPSPFA